jgi:DNA-directed RNA polymerase subunit H
LISTMAIDVRDHRAVPEHSKMNEDEVEELLQKFDAEKDDLPKIERTDAALKQMDVEVGDVIKIKRDSPTAGKTTYYRRVIER